jgi:hypothetical protein
MELIACEKKLNILFPRGISLIIVDLAYGYDHPSRHHAGCNVHKFKNDKYPCNCLFRMDHTNQCTFYKGFLSVEASYKKVPSGVSGGQAVFINRFKDIWAGTAKQMCTCTTVIPKKIICNTCFTPFKQCCGYECVFCFICDGCGVGHSYVDLWKDNSM